MEKFRKSTRVGAYAVQCNTCDKWRLIQDKREYETIRENLYDDPWTCSKKPNFSCDDPADIEYDETQVWAIDRPSLPKAPDGIERVVSLRSDFSKFDVQYVMPNGKRLRSSLEVERFLEANPEYKNSLSIANFSFTGPRIYEDYPFKKTKAEDPISEDATNTNEAAAAAPADEEVPADNAAPADETNSSEETDFPEEMEF